MYSVVDMERQDTKLEIGPSILVEFLTHLKGWYGNICLGHKTCA